MAVDRIQQEWPNLAVKLRRRWRKLTDEDVHARDGNSDVLAHKLQLRYGVDRREAILQVYEFESALAAPRAELERGN